MRTILTVVIFLQRSNYSTPVSKIDRFKLLYPSSDIFKTLTPVNTAGSYDLSPKDENNKATIHSHFI
jgi:hypothetical protein